MTSLRPEEWRLVRQIFDDALALPGGERRQFVAASCLDDERLLRQVSALLDAHERADDFLETAYVAPAADWPDENLKGAQFGPYRLESRIGGGGMGEVYRARDTRLERTVAIKVLLSHVAVDEPSRERFEREARVVAGLNHPHICTLHDIGTYQASTAHGPVPYLVMEFLDGETLADRLAKGALPLEEALQYAIQIASALDTAHRAAIVHRDLKPRNVMLTFAGAKLLDFGLAKAAASQTLEASLAANTELTTPGTIIGTVQYMAPEQLEGLSTDARTDLFAFGCVLYEMLAGKKAFEGRSGASLMTAIMTLQPRPLREVAPLVPASVEGLVVRCLAKRPEDRWQSATEVLHKLKRIADEQRSASGTGWYRALLSVSRPAWAAAVLLLLVLSAGAWIFLSKRPPPSVVPGRATAVQLAVLPLRMVGSVSPGDEHLAVGIADSIITRLAAVKQIGLRPTAAVLQYADALADTAGAAKALAVGHVLVGTIQRNSDTYRITLQLVQSSDGTVTWARSYDVLRSALSNLQDTIAEQVVDGLRLELTAAERVRVRRRYTDNAQAYDLYLRGRASFVNYTEKTMKEAIDDFERALKLDPDYALARASLATASAWFSIRYAYETEASEWGARADRDAKAALAADPSLAEATLAMASAAGTLYGAFNWPAVIADATRALAMDPTLELAHIVRMRAFYHLGLFDRMTDEARAAHRLNPLGNVEIARLEVAASLFGGSYERAREQATALLARSDAPVIRNYLGLAQFYLGDVAGARAALAAVQRAGRPDVRSQAALAGVEAAAGDHVAARARAIAIERGPYMDHHVAYSLGAAWAELGDVGASVKWLQQAADTGFPCYPWLLQDKLLDPIRGDAEFTALLDQLRRRHEEYAARYAPGT
jgi:serine/threonine protein kinase/TolB-like protein